MTGIQAIAVLIIRIWAISSLIWALLGISSTTGWIMSGANRNIPSAFLLGPLISYILLSAFWAVVLCYSKKITAWVLPSSKEQDHKFLIESEDLLKTGTFLIAVFYITEYFPKLLSTGARSVAILMRTNVYFLWSQIWSEMSQLLTPLLVLLIALWLIVRPHHIVRLFAWLRTAGQPAPNPAPEPPQRAD